VPKVPKVPAVASVSPRKQLASSLAKFSPDVEAVAREALGKMEARLPGATRLVYDNYNALAIGFGPNERASDVVFSIAVFPRWVSLFFFEGTQLADPERLLKGSGNRARHIVLESAADLDRPAVKALMAEALDLADPPIPRKGSPPLIIKSISARQRPRRPAARPAR
jgi:hypothetical protein